MDTERVLQEAMEAEAGREEREAREAQMKREDRLVIAMRNAEAIAMTLCKHGERMEELAEAINTLGTQVQNISNQVIEQRGLIVHSLQQKYGHGSTTPGE